MELADDFLSRAIVAQIPCVIKARAPDVSGRRIVVVEASTEQVDLDGDVILQQALMKSANAFVANGHFDIDHLSEFGARLGIANPASYIIGRPLEVTAESGGRTFVRGEIARSSDGKFDPAVNRYDEFWASLQCDPPVRWFSSIYGFPSDLEDCKAGSCPSGATRYVIKSLDWRSLAFTRNPKNTALSSPARIVTAKAFMAELAKSLEMSGSPYMPAPPLPPVPGSMNDVWSNKSCPNCQADSFPSLYGYRQHFAKCMGHPPGVADLLANATMYRHELLARSPDLYG
jgi:hypothetical protein